VIGFIAASLLRPTALMVRVNVTLKTSSVSLERLLLVRLVSMLLSNIASKTVHSMPLS